MDSLGTIILVVNLAIGTILGVAALWVVKQSQKEVSVWEYGKCNGTHARRHLKDGNVQLILHEKEDQIV